MNKLLIIQQEMPIKHRIDIELVKIIILEWVIELISYRYRFDINLMTHFSLDNIYFLKIKFFKKIFSLYEYFLYSL